MTSDAASVSDKIDPSVYYGLDEESQYLKRFAEEALDGYISSLGFGSILDVGCGDGHALRQYLGKGRVEGIDIDYEMISKSSPSLGDILRVVDIRRCPGYLDENRKSFDVIRSNYVFMMMRRDELVSSLCNIEQLLSDEGVFCAVITDPRNRHRWFPGLQAVFDEPYGYHKEGLRYSVLLQARSGDFVDCGIIDYHYPLESYDQMFHEAGFHSVAREDIFADLPYSFAVLYIARK